MDKDVGMLFIINIVKLS